MSSPYTDGRSRVVLVSGGNKECLALLFLTRALGAAFSQTTHDVLALDKKDGGKDWKG